MTDRTENTGHWRPVEALLSLLDGRARSTNSSEYAAVSTAGGAGVSTKLIASDMSIKQEELERGLSDAFELGMIRNTFNREAHAPR